MVGSAVAACTARPPTRQGRCAPLRGRLRRSWTRGALPGLGRAKPRTSKPCPPWGGHRGAAVAVGCCSGRLLLGELGGVAVSGRVVGHSVEPAAVDHPDPGAGQHPHRVRVVVAAGRWLDAQDLRRPGAGVAAVVAAPTGTTAATTPKPENGSAASPADTADWSVTSSSRSGPTTSPPMPHEADQDRPRCRVLQRPRRRLRPREGPSMPMGVGTARARLYARLGAHVL